MRNARELKATCLRCGRKHSAGKGLEGSDVDGHGGGGLQRRHGPVGLGTRPLPQRWRCPPPIRPSPSPTPPRPPSNRHLTCQTLWRALRQHLLVVSSCSWRGAVQPVQAFPPPRSRRPSRCHRLGCKKSTQKIQSCATGGNTYKGSCITAIAANHFILNEPNPIPADLVYLGVFICAFCKCICGIWQDWA